MDVGSRQRLVARVLLGLGGSVAAGLALVTLGLIGFVTVVVLGEIPTSGAIYLYAILFVLLGSAVGGAYGLLGRARHLDG